MFVVSKETNSVNSLYKYYVDGKKAVSAPHSLGTMASRLTFTLILLALPVLQEGQGFSEILNLLKLIKKGEERDELQDILIKKPLAKGDLTMEEWHPKKNTIDANVGWFTVSIAPEPGRVVRVLGEIPVSVCRLRHRHRAVCADLNRCIIYPAIALARSCSARLLVILPSSLLVPVITCL